MLLLRSPIDKPDKMLNLHTLQHPFTHVRITPKGLDMIVEYVAQVRETVGYEVPIAADHFGHIGVDDCIRLECLQAYLLQQKLFVLHW